MNSSFFVVININYSSFFFAKMSAQNERKRSIDSGIIKLKEKMPADVAGTLVDLANELARNHESMKFRFEVIDPTNELKQVEIEVEPVDKSKRVKKSAIHHSTKIDPSKNNSNDSFDCSKIAIQKSAENQLKN